jgi:hypothetical protein
MGRAAWNRPWLVIKRSIQVDASFEFRLLASAVKSIASRDLRLVDAPLRGASTWAGNYWAFSRRMHRGWLTLSPKSAFAVNQVSNLPD